MFKKELKLGGEHRLSGADRKKVRKEAGAVLLGGPEALDALLPPKAELSVARLPAPSRGVVYMDAGVPILLELTGRKDFVPTVAGLYVVFGAAGPLRCVPALHVA